MIRMHIVATALVAVAFSAPAASASELVVIVNPSNPSATLDARTVKAHFLRTLGSWSNGEKVRPIDFVGQPDMRAAFIARILGMSDVDLERYWLEKQYATAENPPTKSPTDTDVIRLVKLFKGAIGFVSKDAAALAGADVKVVMTLSY